MILGRRLIPVLVALLVLQGGLAVLPHLHGPATTTGAELSVDSAHGVDHGCLACSIHTAAMECSEAPSTAAGCSDVSAAAGDCSPILGAASLGTANPRGPPSIV